MINQIKLNIIKINEYIYFSDGLIDRINMTEEWNTLNSEKDNNNLHIQY